MLCFRHKISKCSCQDTQNGSVLSENWFKCSKMFKEDKKFEYLHLENKCINRVKIWYSGSVVVVIFVKMHAVVHILWYFQYFEK